MKLLHVVAGMDPRLGGVCQAIRTSIAGLSVLGVHNEVASLDTPDAAFLQQDAFITHALGPARGPWAYSAALLPWLVRNLARFDAVVVHGLWSYHGYAVRQAARRIARANRPRLFVMPHGMLDPYFQRAPGRRLKAVRNQLYWKLVEARLVNSADGLLFTCTEEQQLAQQPFRPYRPRRTAVVGLGVEQPPAYTAAMREAFLCCCPAAGAQPYLLFLSRIHEKKGVEDLLTAYATLRAGLLPAGPTPAAGAEQQAPLPLLLIAGPGLDTPYGQRMQELVENNPLLRDNVLFSGMLAGPAKWGAFYGCEAFILPSHQENFGIAVVEALACGKPVLLSDQINIWREIQVAGGGLVAPDTAAGITSLLQQWQKLSPGAKQTLQKNAHAGFQHNFAVLPAARRFRAAIQE